MAIKIDPLKCIACMACAVNCPTEALSYHDTAATRKIFCRMNHCISCGTCVAICDEKAAELRHQVKLPTLRLNRKIEISRANLEACERCGVFFISEKHLSKIRKQNSDSYILMCPECKQMVHVEHQYKLFF